MNRVDWKRWELCLGCLAMVHLAHAHDYGLGLSSATSDSSARGGSATTEADANADRRGRERAVRAAREKRRREWAKNAVEGSPCTSNATCYGWCVEGRCLDEQPVGAGGCGGAGCPDGTSCADGRCVPAPSTASPPPSNSSPARERCSESAPCSTTGMQCRDDSCVLPPQDPGVGLDQCDERQTCGPGKTCRDGRCLSDPPSPPSSSRALERWLRFHGVELREELALGEGPQLRALVSSLGESPGWMGPLLRSHRAELVELIGPESDQRWPPLFLERIERLGAWARRPTDDAPVASSR